MIWMVLLLFNLCAPVREWEISTKPLPCCEIHNLFLSIGLNLLFTYLAVGYSCRCLGLRFMRGKGFRNNDLRNQRIPFTFG